MYRGNLPSSLAGTAVSRLTDGGNDRSEPRRMENLHAHPNSFLSYRCLHTALCSRNYLTNAGLWETPYWFAVSQEPRKYLRARSTPCSWHPVTAIMLLRSYAPSSDCELRVSSLVSCLLPLHTSWTELRHVLLESSQHRVETASL